MHAHARRSPCNFLIAAPKGIREVGVLSFCPRCFLCLFDLCHRRVTVLSIMYEDAYDDALSDAAVSDESSIDDYYYGTKEVTHDEFRKSLLNNSKPPRPPRRGFMGKIRSPMVRKKRLQSRPNNDDRPTIPSVQSREQEDLKSVTGRTVGSNDETVMMSNRREKPANSDSTAATNQKKKPWKSLKRMIKGSSNGAPKDADRNANSARARALSADVKQSSSPKLKSLRKRFGSEDSKLKKDTRSEKAVDDSATKRQQLILDDAIKGRLDGMDVLFLGSARLDSLYMRGIDPPPVPWELSLNQPITTLTLSYSSTQMVTDMIWTSAGRDTPEMLLEGYIPAGDDRWTVRLADVKAPSCLAFAYSSEDQTAPTDDDHDLTKLCESLDPCGFANAAVDLTNVPEEEDEDKEPPVDVLIQSMWGDAAPPPTHLSRTKSGASLVEDDENDIMQLASDLSVPIDLDEDTFMIDTAEHLQAVHDIATVPLKSGRYADAIKIFEKVLKGLKHPSHLIGSTQHNIGIIQTWEGDFRSALNSFELATDSRVCDAGTAVSLLRTGMSHFALDDFDTALSCFRKALELNPKDNATRAKVLNNVGVAQYQRKYFMEALKAFTDALEIQRIWLDGPLRREPIVFDASVTLSNIAKIYLHQHEYEPAFQAYEEALLLQTTAFRKDHVIVLSTLSNLAYAKAMGGDFGRAIQIYKGVSRAQQTRWGPECREAAETAGLLATLYLKMGNEKDALECLRTLVKWQRQNFDQNNPSLESTRAALRKIEESSTADKVWV